MSCPYGDCSLSAHSACLTPTRTVLPLTFVRAPCVIQGSPECSAQAEPGTGGRNVVTRAGAAGALRAGRWPRVDERAEPPSCYKIGQLPSEDKRMRTPQSVLVGFALAVLGLPLAAPAEDIPGPAVDTPFPHPLRATDQHGRQHTLSSLIAEKGVALFFVRSADWCPFCKEQLVDVNERRHEFRELGINVVSISVDEVGHIATFATQRDIGYSMLADPNGDINESLGIRDEQYPVGSAQFGVPRPTVYVLDASGTIRLRYMEPTYRTRPDLDTVLTDIADLNL